MSVVILTELGAWVEAITRQSGNEHGVVLFVNGNSRLTGGMDVWVAVSDISSKTLSFVGLLEKRGGDEIEATTTWLATALTGVATHGGIISRKP